MDEKDDQIKKNNQELVDLAKLPAQKSLSISVLKRFMSEEELSQIINNYSSHKYNIGSWAHRERSVALARPITPEEEAMMTDYMFNHSSSVKDLEEKHHVKKSTLRARVNSIAVRYLYQHREELKI